MDPLERIPTRSSLSKQVEFKTCVYKEKEHKEKSKITEPTERKTTRKVEQEFDMKRARHEIIKFGISGFEGQRKLDAKINLAVRLGAKPPKNKYKNYKLLQEEKKKAKAAEKEHVELQQIGKNQFGKSNAKGKFTYKKSKLKLKKDILDDYGKATMRLDSKKPKK